MNKENQGKTINKEAFRMLALEIGLNAACRKLDVPIPTGKSWARRGGWELPRRSGGRPPRALSASSLHPVADVLVESHKGLETRTKSGLARATTKAAEHAAEQDGATNLNCSGKLRDLASAAARIFGWDGDKASAVTLNQIVISQEQLEQIRALRAS